MLNGEIDHGVVVDGKDSRAVEFEAGGITLGNTV